MAIPPSYPALREHLERVFQEPYTALDLRLIDKLRLELLANIDPKVAAVLLVQVSAVLPVLQEDPTPLTSLAKKAGEYLDFSQIQSIQPSVDFLAGIKAPSPPINLLALSLLGKAGHAATDAAIIAANQDLVVSLVELWLSTPSTETAQVAFDVLWSLLEVDFPKRSKDYGTADKAQTTEGDGQGLMWRRIFDDKSVYVLLFQICNLQDTTYAESVGKRQKTVAQGRLMEFVLKAGSLDWQAVSQSHFRDVESSAGSDSLLSFVACNMVEEDDVLLQMTLIQFYSDLLRINAPGILQHPSASTASCPPFSSPSLEFMLSSGLHAKVLAYYTDPSALDPAVSTYLTGPVMAYISQYAVFYPSHLLQNPQTALDILLSRILEALDIPSAQWAHGTVPSGDLNLLASLPRVMLLEAGSRSLNPLLLVPSKPPNKDAFDALSRVFNGPRLESWKLSPEEHAKLDENPTSPRAEAVAARALYFQYLYDHPDLWASVVGVADIMAMRDTALAAIALIKAVATANWETVPANSPPTPLTSSRFPVPTEDQMSRLGPAQEGVLPATGAWALLVPPGLTTVLPYLFKAPQTYANFVAGGAADTESAVWRIATAKYDALSALEAAVRKIGGKVDGMDELVASLRRRVAQGPWGPISQVGSRIDALEM
jgi:hypothetical protein